MKRKKTLKSLAELSADSLGTPDAAPGKAKPPELHVLAEDPRKVPAGNMPQAPEVRGYQNWGINE